MKAIHRLAAEEALILVVGVGVLAWMAIPDSASRVAEVLVPGSHTGGASVEGEVMTEAGQPLDEVPVGLFHGYSNELLELTHTDRAGRFAFRQLPPTYHVLALPSTSGTSPGWLLDLDRGIDFDLAVVVPSASLLEVQVVDASGRPVPGAEVRSYRDGGGTVIPTAIADRGRTGEKGRAALRAPGRAVIAVFHPDHRPVWAIPGAVSEGVPLRMTLDPLP